MPINIQKIDHVVLITSDIKACITFYETLGFRAENTLSHYELFAGDFKINVHYLGKELKPNAHTPLTGTLDICMEVEGELTDWQDTLTASGYKVTEIAIKHGARGRMKSFYVRDVDYNLLELCSYCV